MVSVLYSLFKNLPAERHLGCFHFLVITNKSSMDTMYRFLYEHKFSFL